MRMANKTWMLPPRERIVATANVLARRIDRSSSRPETLLNHFDAAVAMLVRMGLTPDDLCSTVIYPRNW